MISIRAVFLLLTLYICRDITFNFFADAVAPYDTPKILFPFPIRWIAGTATFRQCLAAFFLGTVLIGFYKDTRTTRLLHAITLFLMIGVGLLTDVTGYGHSRWPYIVTALLGVCIADDRSWVTWTRFYLAMLYAIAGIHKLSLFFLEAENATLTSLAVRKTLTNGSIDGLSRLLITYPLFGQVAYLFAALFQISVLVAFVMGARAYWIGITLLAFHLFNYYYLEISFFPQMFLVILFFLAAHAQEKNFLRRTPAN